jgi:hypothetical protein
VLPRYVAEIDADTVVAVVAVVTANVVEVAPAATMTLAGVAAMAVFELTSVTAKPPAGAAALIVTLPVDDVPPVTLVGVSEIAERAGGFTVRVAFLVTPPDAADTRTDTGALTAEVVTVNVAEVAPARTVTVFGTETTALAVESDTTAPPAGAAGARVTVPVDERPPTIELGLTLTELSAGGVTAAGLIVRIVLFVTPA